MLYRLFVQYNKETVHLKVPLGCKFAACVLLDVLKGLACRFNIVSPDFGYFSMCSCRFKIGLQNPHP